VEFEMRYDRWSRPLLTVLGAGPKRTFIRVVDGMLHIKFISFRLMFRCNTSAPPVCSVSGDGGWSCGRLASIHLATAG
jgi:hypothetical protein